MLARAARSEKLSRAALNERAAAAGVEAPDKLPSKAAVLEALKAAV